MITVATITSKSIKNSTILYGITISLFKIPGSKVEPSFTAVCSTNPGTYEPYSIGDTVYVGFVNNLMAEPVILGKVQKDLPNKSNEKSATFQYLNSLEVTGNTSLSKDTKIGDLKYNDLKNCISSVGNLGSLVKSYDYAKFTESSETISATDKDNVVGIWIDDKSIYRKTFKITFSSQTSTWTKDIDISNLTYDNMWVDSTHTFISGDNYTYSCVGSILKQNKKIRITGTSITDTNLYIYVTVEYTK